MKMKTKLKKIVGSVMAKRRYLIPGIVFLILLSAISPILYQALFGDFDNGNAEREAFSSAFNSSRLDGAKAYASPPAVSHYGFSAHVVNETCLTFYDRALLLHSEYQDVIQGLLVLAVITTSIFAVSKHLPKFNKSKKQFLVFVIISVPFVNTLFLLVGCYCNGELLTLLEGFQEMYMNLTVVAMGKLVLLNIRYPSRLNMKKILFLKIFLWQAPIVWCVGTVFQIVYNLIGYDLSSYELLFCFAYMISSVISGVAVLLLYSSGGQSNLQSAQSKMSFTKLLDIFLLQDIYLRYKKMQHAVRASIFMAEMLFTGFLLIRLFPAKRYARKICVALKKVRIARRNHVQVLPVQLN